MSFALPYALLGLLAVPILVAAYLWQLRRRRRAAVQFSNVALIRAVLPRQRMWRRHVPLALVLASLALLGLAAGRPQVRAEVPISSSAVILAVDVSGSMCATDVSPNRLAAAQEAVRDFIDKQDDRTRIGLVVFSGFAQVAVAPTTNHDDLLHAVDGLTTGRGTTIGAAILKSIDAIAEINPDVAPVDSGDTGAGDGQGSPTPTPEATPGAPEPKAAKTVPEIVVLLTDGANTRGVTPEEAAVQAAARGVRVYPIGFGTTEPTQMVCTSDQLGGGLFDGPPGGFGGGLGPGGRNFLVVDEEALQTVARTTGGEYFKASDADQLQGVLNDLPKHVDVQERNVEISVAFAGLAALLLLLGLGLAGRWTAHPQ
ncbi:VWA domain-containing protein [Pedococcus bigeumensis]|uniref:VWA domain-containing protein n=1 Tax=Pedococcus bigeumensis TaxID=433644 RepID=A0A502CPW2_9MICO|nr:VWA domain-containing protein [Pedococcus bigeumensis]TPG14843.1 VWA domain-containing protein [Pedococcus bigeumensis]